MRSAPIILAAALILGGCDTPFDPRGTYEDRLVLFGILTPASDTVAIRLQSTYDPPTIDPLSHVREPDLSGGTASLFWNSSSAALRDTVVPHPDSSRYTNGLRLLTTSPLRVSRGTSYTVRVDVPGYPRAEATTTVPGPTTFRFRNEGILTSPALYPDRYIDLIVSLRPEAFGYLPKLMIEFQVLSEGGRVERREIPSGIEVSGSETRLTYPTFRGPSTVGLRTDITEESFPYDATAYRSLLESIGVTYGVANVRYIRILATVTTVDEHFYKYYYIVNGFFDPFTVRTDRPDYSNVRGGVGVVGAAAVDSLTVVLPPSGL